MDDGASKEENRSGFIVAVHTEVISCWRFLLESFFHIFLFLFTFTRSFVSFLSFSISLILTFQTEKEKKCRLLLFAHKCPVAMANEDDKERTTPFSFVASSICYFHNIFFRRQHLTAFSSHIPS